MNESNVHLQRKSKGTVLALYDDRAAVLVLDRIRLYFAIVQNHIQIVADRKMNGGSRASLKNQF